MDVRIGVTQATREISIELEDDAAINTNNKGTSTRIRTKASQFRCYLNWYISKESTGSENFWTILLAPAARVLKIEPSRPTSILQCRLSFYASLATTSNQA